MNATLILAVAVMSVVDFKVVPPAPPAGTWAQHMQEMAYVMNDLLPLLIDPAAFNDRRNATHIAEASVRFRILAEDVHQAGTESWSVERPDADPSLAIIGGMLANNAARASLAFHEGNKEQARSLLRKNVQYCGACHTRSPDDAAMTPFNVTRSPVKMTDGELGDLYVALRNYSDARRALDRAIGDRRYAHFQPGAWFRSAKQALSLAIRVDNDPGAAQMVAELTAQRANNTADREAAHDWQQSIAAWRSERPGEAPLSKARKLLDVTVANDDTNHDVEILRALAILHEALRTGLSDRDASQALHMLGNGYQALADYDTWELPESYFEACILRSPHTEIARTCYLSYEKNVFVGYTNDAKSDVPSSISEHLTNLEALSRPNTPEF